MDTNEALVAFAKSEGASLIGFAPVSRFNDAPLGHRPNDFLPDAKSVIVLGMRISDSIVDYNDYHNHFTGRASWAKETVSRHDWAFVVRYNYYLQVGHFVQDELLLYLASKIAWKLEDEGYQSMPMATTSTRGLAWSEIRTAQAFYPWSQRHAAVMAGLGEFGYNNLVITPEYGPRMRWNSLITEAEFEYTPLLSQKVCLRDRCKKCLSACTGGAIQLRDGIDDEKVFYTTPAKTDYRLCLSWDERGVSSSRCFFYGTCLRVCPIKPNLRKNKKVDG